MAAFFYLNPVISPRQKRLYLSLNLGQNQTKNTFKRITISSLLIAH